MLYIVAQMLRSNTSSLDTLVFRFDGVAVRNVGEMVRTQAPLAESCLMCISCSMIRLCLLCRPPTFVVILTLNIISRSCFVGVRLLRVFGLHE